MVGKTTPVTIQALRLDQGLLQAFTDADYTEMAI